MGNDMKLEIIPIITPFYGDNHTQLIQLRLPFRESKL